MLCRNRSIYIKLYQNNANTTKQNAETRLPNGFSAFCLFLEEKI